MTYDVPPSLAEVLAQPAAAQRAFPWSRSAWDTAIHDLPDVQRAIDSLPDKVDRNLVRDVVASHLAYGDVLPAFVSAMIWGYSDTGYGPTRVRWVLTGVKIDARNAPVRTDVVALLRTAAETVRLHGPVEGFRFMNNAGRIKHLAGAFFTKWLYFASAIDSADDATAAPILDRQVQLWLKRQAAIGINTHRTIDYERYLDVLQAWGDAYNRTPVQVEKAIFGLATGRT